MVVGEIPTGIDVLVLGAGPGGYVAAIRAAQLGLDVTLVDESERLGGICLNHGCIPSKALIHAAGIYHGMKGTAGMGIRAEGRSGNLGEMMVWKEGVVARLTAGGAKLCGGNGVNVVTGRLAFTSPGTAEIAREDGVERVEFENAVIATGSRPVTVPGLEPDGETVLTSREALALREVPERLLVVGGGYIGLELGTFYAKLGAKVTVVEMLDGLLPGVDRDLVRMVARRLKALGVEVRLSTTVQGLSRSEAGLKVEVKGKGKGKGERIPADRVLVAAGRRPDAEGSGLEKTGVERDDRGFLRIDSRCRTSVPNLFAIGDVAGEPMLAHKASREGIVAAEVIAGMESARDWQAVPAVIFTDPEIAVVGLSEEEAKERGIEIVVGRFPFSASGRALAMNRAGGFVKVVAEKETRRVLGVRIVGPEASTLIGEGTLAVEMAATLDDLSMTIHPHPTLPESLMEAAEAAGKKAIHILNR